MTKKQILAGPWKIDGVYLRSAIGYNLAVIHQSREIKEQLTAQLEALPELLEACETVLKTGEQQGGKGHEWIPGGIWHEIGPKLSAAIAKAKGQP